MANSNSAGSESPNQSKLAPNLVKGCGCLAFGVALLAIPAVIFLPGLMSSADAAREMEGKSNLTVIHRAQQAYFFENEEFSSSAQDLELGMPLEGENYRYSIVVQPTQPASVLTTAVPLLEGLSSYTGAVFAIPTVGGGNQPLAILCQSQSAALVSMPDAPKSISEDISCPSGAEKVD